MGTDRDLPIIARVEDGNTLLDMRTINPAFDEQVAASVKQVL